MNDDTCMVTPPTRSLARAASGRLLRGAGELVVVDSRGALGNAARRGVVLDELARHVREVRPEVLGGVANSGSTWGVLLSDRLGVDFVNILVDGPRRKGLGRQLEPDGLVDGKSVLLIDNWIETGASIRTASSIVRRARGHVVGVLCVSAAPRHSADMPVHIAFPFDDLVRAVASTAFNNDTTKETQ